MKLVGHYETGLRCDKGGNLLRPLNNIETQIPDSFIEVLSGIRGGISSPTIGPHYILSLIPPAELKDCDVG